MLSLRTKDKRAIENGYGPWAVCKKLREKGVARIVDTWRDTERFSKMADIELTEKGETLKRKINDPTVEHL